MADFATATRAYTAWVGGYLALDAAGLAEKRRKMDRKKVFPFLRGSFYRWAWQFSAVAPALREAPRLLSVGDAHLENYGTWRDAEGRLVWGVNDFDEAAELPFTSDLVRLATSLLLARRDEPRKILAAEAEGVAALLQGYREGLAEPLPFVLDEAPHGALRAVAMQRYDPVGEWQDISTRGEAATPGDLELLHLLLTSLPQGARPLAFRRPTRGLGALGRPRWSVIASWHGGLVAREAKATAPSAAVMPARPASRVTDHRRLAAEARRAPDPGFCIAERWVVRRLSPEARKIELADMLAEGSTGADPAEGQRALLGAMGREMANVHAGTAHDPEALAAWLGRLPEGWLLQAAEAAASRVVADHAAFRRDPEVVEQMPAC